MTKSRIVDRQSLILALDCSTEACSAALFAADGECLDSADERIGRGHSERLVPMIAELMDGRNASAIIAGVGPGSFTGIRVAIAAAQGLGIGWGAPVHGMSSLALLAANGVGDGGVAAALLGGHGELFVQQFGPGLIRETDLLNLPPVEAARQITAECVVGPGAAALVEARGWGSPIIGLPSARFTLGLPIDERSLPPRPLYARAPDAKARAAA